MKAFLIAAGVFAVLDALWLGLVANKFYKDQIGFLLADKPNWIAAILFYVIFLVGLTILVIIPADTPTKALAMGALFGLVTYATYDLTNQATLAKWPVIVTVVDLCWGVFAAGVTAFVTKHLVS